MSGNHWTPRCLGHIRQLIGIALAEPVTLQVNRDFEFLKRNCLYRRFQYTTQQRGGPLHIILQNILRHFPLNTRTKGDDSLAVLTQQIMISTGLIIKTFRRGFRYDFNKVSIPLPSFQPIKLRCFKAFTTTPFWFYQGGYLL